MTLVLCDGEAASLKALEVAAVPGLLLKKHDNRQLVVVCAWKDTRSVGTASTGEDNGPNQAQIQHMQTQLAPLTNALSTINGSRYTQNTLNYAIESHRISLPRVEIRPPQSASKPPAPTAGGGGSNKQPSPLPGATGLPIDAASAADVAAAAVTQNLQTEAADAFGQQVAEHALGRSKHHGIRIIAFGVGNAVNEKKQIIVGSTGKALLGSLVYNPFSSGSSRFRSVLKLHREVEAAGQCLTESMMTQVKQHYHQSGTSLLAVKSSGAAVRPTTGSRILVLMFPEFYASKEELAKLGPNDPIPATNAALNAAIALAREKQDRVGILAVTNNGIAKPTPNDDDEADENAAPYYTAMIDETIDILMAAGLTGNDDDDEDSVEEVVVPTRPADDAMSMYGGGINQNVNANAQMLAAFPLVSYLALEPTRDFPQAPTIEQVPQQLVRQLNAIKADILVVPPPMEMIKKTNNNNNTASPSTAPSPRQQRPITADTVISITDSPLFSSSSSVLPQSVMETLFGMPKPHILVSGTQ